ncbi:hypothetical protein BFP72_00025 [Reichenbachiella sp. 5M10]|uniref:DUF1684 domain-containing protein n=1 Tax=Reichenbachiella sp. 5M10 TaxID=1889772 RepID=UPI000C162032|nr:DUF1684 domain-containing protein [Reichenbachiella sp. 5M10]PIB33930.1 hypothetical protein BFP72_00025 [Reichenbachiella sp. 5M10]
MKKIILITGVCILSYLVISTLLKKTEPSTAYIESIQEERDNKDQFMSTSSNSPFHIYGDTTVNLKYFPIDETYKVIAQIDHIETRQKVTLANSDGTNSTYIKFAYASFELNNKSQRLLILKNILEGSLFTAFTDQTSTEETYGAGRYLDLDFNRAKRITIDFNKAYNPYCNYNHEYSCPFPPSENSLNLVITAGEKDYEK